MTISFIIVGVAIAVVFFLRRAAREKQRDAEMGELLAKFLTRPVTGKDVAMMGQEERGELPEPGMKETLKEFAGWLAGEGIENEKRERVVKQYAKAFAKKGELQ